MEIILLNGSIYKGVKEISSTKVVHWRLLTWNWSFSNINKHKCSSTCERFASKGRWNLCTTKRKRGRTFSLAKLFIDAWIMQRWLCGRQPKTSTIQSRKQLRVYMWFNQGNNQGLDAKNVTNLDDLKS
jgi:hypothetical protein